MTILIYIGQRQNSSSSYFTSSGKIDSAFNLSECKQELECKFPVSSGAGVTFLGAGVKKVTPITSGPVLSTLWCCQIHQCCQPVQCCQPCGFPANLGLFFLWICGFFWRLAGCLFLGLFWLKFASVLGLFFADFCIADCLFMKFHGHFALSIYWKMKVGRVFV